MTDQNVFGLHQLVLAQDAPHWGYGRIVETCPQSGSSQYRVYFYHTDRYEMLNAQGLKNVPDNYQPPFAPDPRHYFGEKDS